MKWLRRMLEGPKYHSLFDKLTEELKRGDHRAASTTAAECVRLAERCYGHDDAELCAPLYALASAHLAADHCAEAANASERALKIAGPDVESTQPPRYQLLEQRAAIASRAGDDAALVLALSELASSNCPDHVGAAALNRLGLHHGRAGDYAAAETQFLAALDLVEQNADALRGVMIHAEILHNGATFRDAEDASAVARAADWFDQALDIAAHHLTADGSLLEAKVAHNFAVLRQELQQDDEALLLYRRALAAFERDHRESDPIVRPTLARLGRLLQSMRLFEEAVVLLRRAHGLAVIELGEEHEVTGRIALWLGDANSDTFR